MSPDTIQKVLQITESFLEAEFATSPRVTFKLISVFVADKVSITESKALPVIKAYIKGRHDLCVQRGRTGGISKILPSPINVIESSDVSEQLAKAN